MRIIDVIQESETWLAIRLNHFCASEAPALFGASPHMTRTQLLDYKVSGIAPEYDAFTKCLFKKGHDAEVAFRPIAEKIIGEDFYPIVGTLEESLPLLASFDGVSMDGATLFEHKLHNKKLFEMTANSDLSAQYYWQLEHQILVSDAAAVKFFCSDGTEGNYAHCTYVSAPSRRAQLIAAWTQFLEDKKTHVVQEYISKPVAQAVTNLPAVSVQVTGSIVVAGNLQAFEIALTDFIEHRLILEPKTDQDFADLDLQIKALKKAESALDAAEASMLSQVESVDTAKRMKDKLHAMARSNRLMAEKLLTAKKDSIKRKIIDNAVEEYGTHVRLQRGDMRLWDEPTPPPAFAAAIKGLSSIDSMRNAISVVLANGKIAATESANAVRAALKCIEDEGKDYDFLLADKQALIVKPIDDLRTLIRARITEHKAAESKRLEADRERIRAEEVKKLFYEQEAEARRITDEAVRVAREANAQVITTASPEPTAIVLAFLASRTWSTPAAEKTARATLIEFIKFQGKI
jgi:predicted phage-related endonuclease